MRLLSSVLLVAAAAADQTTRELPDQLEYDSYAAQFGKCDEIDYCMIRTYDRCVTATHALEIDVMNGEISRRDNDFIVPGCSVNFNNRAVRFNENIESVATQNWISSLCGPCDYETPPINPNAGKLVETENYIFVDDRCDCHGYEDVADKEECELAAEELEHEDITANLISTRGDVRGCSINPRKKLRFNSNSDSIALTASYQSEVRKSICKKVTATTVDSDTCTLQYKKVESDTCFGEEGWCQINDLAECELAADYLHILPWPAVADAEEISSSLAQGGCLHNGGEHLVFNSDEAGVRTGEYVNARAVCKVCDPTASTAAPKPEYILADQGDVCSGEYCDLPSNEKCSDAAAALSTSVTEATTQFSPAMPTGCAASSTSLTFNMLVTSTATPTASSPYQMVCQRCDLLAESHISKGLQSDESDKSAAEKGDTKWWAWMAGSIASVAVVGAVVVAAVVHKKKQQRKTVVPVDDREQNLPVDSPTVGERVTGDVRVVSNQTVTI